MDTWGSVFVSHASDMAAFPPGRSFVQAAVEAVLKAGGHPVDMGQFAAREDTPADYCQRRVHPCDVYLAVVGFRYGSRVPGRADGRAEGAPLPRLPRPRVTGGRRCRTRPWRDGACQ